MSEVLKLLIGATGLREADVRGIILRAPKRYKVYTIAKRSGGRRPIAQPTKEVKFLQSAFVDTFLSKLPVHDAATAYRRGMSTLCNVLPHAGNGPILKMDFKEFFPSIKANSWRRYCVEHSLLSEEDIWMTELLLFFRPKGAHYLQLAIGAPSSPCLSNILMYEFDRRVCEAIAPDRVTYTRYADDMTFSAPRTGFLVNVRRNVAKVIRGLPYPSLDINSEKTTYITTKYHRVVTGLTLSNDGRVTLGRNQKRQIRACVHRFLMESMPDIEIARLRGRLAYVNSVEPGYLDILRARYGSETIELLLKSGGIGH